MCTHPNTFDVPAPDYTFHKYHETGRQDSWDSTRRAIGAAAAARSPWRERQPVLLWRGTTRSGRASQWEARARAVAAVQRLAPRLAQQGVTVDLVDTGWGVDLRRHGVLSREAQCNARFLLHVRGTTYSASLRYQLACGSPVAAVLGDAGSECA